MDPVDKTKLQEDCSVETALLDRYCGFFSETYHKKACEKAVDAFAVCIEHRKIMYEQLKK